MLAVSDSGVGIPREHQRHIFEPLFTTNKQASMVLHNTPPGTDTSGIYTAVTGYYPVVTNGVNLWSLYSNQMSSAYYDYTIHGLQPRIDQ